MSAAEIARGLGGRKVGPDRVAKCPAHDDRTPSLSISEVDGKPLVHCHAGCSQAEVIDSLRSRGLWDAVDVGHDNRDRRQRTSHERDETRDRSRSDAALRIWQSSIPASDTLVVTYLHSRGISMPPPLSLRFHPGLKHPTGESRPTMVALIIRGRDDEPIGVHRTILARDGRGKAPVTPQKMMLGRCRGGAVRLAVAGDQLMVSEGIENALDLPVATTDITILADGDDAGEKAAATASQRWKAQGRHVRVARPPPGLDFNDMLASDLSIELTL